MSGTQKAALLLASMDPGTAAEFLKAAKPELVTQIAAELVYMDTQGARARDAVAEHVRDFMVLLQTKRTRKEEPAGGPGRFVRQVLESAVGRQRCDEILGQAHRMVDARDPFLQVRDAPVEEIAQAVSGQHPQVAALVLMELAPPKSAALIPLLDDTVRREAVQRMTMGESVSPEARVRVASMVRSRLEAQRKAAAAVAAGAAPPPVAPTAPTPAAGPAAKKPKVDPRLRQVATLLRGLATELRDGLVKAIAEQNAEISVTVQNLMVLWEDLPLIDDRTLQNVVRSVDGRAMALALVGADPAVTARIRQNISERARAMIDEETQLMKNPKTEDIEQARETLLGFLREINARGELQFAAA